MDAGGTWLRACAEDDRGRRWTTRTRAGPDLDVSLRELWRRRRLSRANVAHVVVAARGVWTLPERRATARQLRGLGRRITVLSDVEAAYRGAIGDSAGLLVLAGTGSIMLARTPRGRWLRAGGLGPLFGDGGSAFALGRDWLAAADPKRARQLARAPDAVARIAALAPRVLRLASRGNGPARLSLARGTLALAVGMRDVAAAAHLPAPLPVSWAGGLLENRVYREGLWRTARRLGLRIAPGAPRASALEATLALAKGSLASSATTTAPVP